MSKTTSFLNSILSSLTDGMVSNLAGEVLNLEQQKERLVQTGKYLFGLGCCVGSSGNMSVRLPDGYFLMTNKGVSLGRMRANDLAVLDAQGNLIAGENPTKEAMMHLAIYAAKPEVNAIVHLHSTYLTALASMENVDRDNALRPFTPYMVLRIGKLPVIPYAAPGSEELMHNLLARVQNSRAFLLQNHGVVVCGSNIYDAVDNAQELEETAKLYFLTKNRGINYLTDAQIAELEAFPKNKDKL